MWIQRVLTITAMAGLFALGGCQSTGGPAGEGGAAGGPGGGAGSDSGAVGVGALPVAEISIEAMDNPENPLSTRIIYFEFDSSEIAEEYQPVIAAHAQLLAQNPELKLTLEGHTDERGSREYNIALGERRAKAVEKLLLLQGAASEQIQVVSFGEERPAALDHDEAAWRLNRRVELIYPDKQ